MARIRCGTKDCVYNQYHYCTADRIDLSDLHVFAYEADGETLAHYNKCLTYEKKTDYVKFFEERGFG